MRGGVGVCNTKVHGRALGHVHMRQPTPMRPPACAEAVRPRTSMSGYDGGCEAGGCRRDSSAESRFTRFSRKLRTRAHRDEGQPAMCACVCQVLQETTPARTQRWGAHRDEVLQETTHARTQRWGAASHVCLCVSGSPGNYARAHTEMRGSQPHMCVCEAARCMCMWGSQPRVPVCVRGPTTCARAAVPCACHPSHMCVQGGQPHVRAQTLFG